MPGQDAGATQAGPSSTPGGGIGAPIGTDDPLTKYKWWILGGLALLLAAGAAFFLRKPPGAAQAGFAPTASIDPAAPSTFTGYAPVPGQTSAVGSSALLNALKEELFAIESEKINGTISPEDYASVKSALEIVLKRALSRK
jgi:hypothetical protein